MAQKTVWLPEIGELTLAKRQGARHIRLSVSSDGRIRVGLPAWAPYSAGVSFALSRREWLIKHKAKISPQRLGDGEKIGKSHRLRFVFDHLAKKTTTRVSGGAIIIKSHADLYDPAVQASVKEAAERALRREAQNLLPARLCELAKRHGFKYRSVKIKKLTSRWGSCSSQKDITLNFFLVQLPWELIDYVLLHELLHTNHLNHGPAFWSSFEKLSPNPKLTRKQIRQHRPMINTVAADVS